MSCLQSRTGPRLLTKHLQAFQRRHAQNEILFREIQSLYILCDIPHYSF